MQDELREMIIGFVEDSHEAFESIENELLNIESNPDDINIINGIFRVMHTIKGTAGFLSLDDIARLSHSLESIFDQIRRAEIVITADLMDVLLPAIDLLKLMVFELVETEKSDYDLKLTFDRLSEISSMEGSTLKTLDNSDDSEVVEVEEKEVSAARQEPEESEHAPPITAALLQEFVVEAEEHLVVIEENLLQLEKHPEDINPLTEIFRSIHSIKGTSDYVRLEKITKLSHRLETLFDNLRKKLLQYNNELADVVLKALDLLRTLVFMVKMGDSDDFIIIEESLEHLDRFLSRCNSAPETDSKIEEPVVKEETVAADSDKLNSFLKLSSQQMIAINSLGEELLQNKAGSDELSILHRAIRTLKGAADKHGIADIKNYCAELEEFTLKLIAKECKLEDIADFFSGNLKALADSLAAIESTGRINTAETNNSFSNTEFSKKTKEAKLSKKDEKAVVSATKDSSVSKDLPKVAGGEKEIKTMRVDSHRLDTFMNLIGELIITRNAFNHISGELGAQKIPGDLLQKLKMVETSLNRISGDLQVNSMEMRLVPVKTVFQKIPRLVRDIARKTSKKIQVQMIGENTEIDKSIVEIIGDPLVHIIRNSCDHGVETPEERLSNGKAETGTIIIKATHLGGAIAIDIIDDGKGVNTERVLKIAIERGLIDPADAEKLDTKTINNLIFKPGFSTAEEVTDISGRGVGMDVVMTNISRIHGSVDVDSSWGSGTQVRLTLPLTLAVMDALIISNQGQKFAIPLDAVSETLEINEQSLQYLKDKEAIELRGKVIGISRLEKLLGAENAQSNEDNILNIVFLKVGNKEIGIGVSELHTQQEIVVKPLQGFLSQIPGLKGSTILGDGEIILILEPTELVELASQ